MNPLPDNHPATDDALLGALAAGNPAALARLMERHGGLVLSVARGVLRDHHAAEDVAQAVFLALARKARRLRGTGTVAPWLYRVTHDLAVNAVRQQERRRRREQEAAAMPSLAEPPRESLTPEQHQQLHAQLRGLPERYRAPLVLCYLEGQPGEQAAQALGLHPAALRKRLERGRDRLRRRLSRLGWVVGAGALTALLSAESGAAVLPATFVASTVSAATGGAVSTTVAALTQGVLKMMFWSNVKLVAAVAAASVVVTGTSVVVAQKTVTSQSPANPVMDSKRLLVEGQKRLRDDKLLEAVELFKHAQTGATDDELRTEILYWLGEAHQRTGNGDEATRCWKELTVQYPTSKWARFGRGQLASRTPPVSGNAGTPVLAGTGDPGKVFKAIDTNNPGTYLDGKWGYHYVIVADGPQTGYRQGTLKYDSRDLPAAQPGDFILTPWGWMQWQEQGRWLPVAEKPATGTQLPDPAK